MTILRRTAALFLLGFAFILFFLGGLLRTVDTLVGSGSKISDSATSILSTTGGSEAIADALITQLTKDADPTVKAVMTAKKAQLVTAVATTIRDPQTLQLLSDDFLVYYNAMKNNTAASFNPQPIIWRLTAAMHSVDARIPSNPHDVGEPIIYTPKDKPPQLVNEMAGTASYAVLFVGLAIALLVVIFLIKHRTRKLVALGLTLGLPGVVMISGASSVKSAIMKNTTDQEETARRLIELVVNRVGSGLMGTGMTLLVVALLVVGIWQGAFIYRLKAAGGATIAPVHSETPEPPVASATDDPGVQ
jgi:uncharacterized integral membrane protein